LLTVAAFPRDKLVQTINLHSLEFALKYWGTTLKNQNCIREEIKSSLKSGSGFCLPVQNLRSSGFLYNTEKQATRCNNKQFNKIPKLARHVSGNSYAYLQEH